MSYRTLIIACFLFCCLELGLSFNITFTTQPKNEVSLEGFSTSLNCAAIASPPKPITYLWRLNGKFINTNVDSRIRIASNGSLRIDNVVTNDFGVYQCVVQCSDGSVISQPAKLEKAEFRVAGRPVNKQYTVKEGVPFYLEAVKFQSKPDAKFEWKICRNRYCKVDQSRMYITAKGNLMMPALSWTDSGSQFFFTISPKFHNPITYVMATVKLTDRLTSTICPNSTVRFLPTPRNFTVKEGENVNLDCLAVFIRCGNPLQVEWKRYDNPVKLSRRLELRNVQKSNEGVYKCYALVTGYPASVYHINVIEKPKLVVEPPSVYLLPASGLVPSGTARGCNYTEWYTNAEQIKGNSDYYEVLANSSLRIKFFSESLAGIYQVFYHNEAGVVSRTIRVDIKNTICGGKLTNESGSIDFLNMKNLPRTLIHCVWLIQTPDSRYIKLNFTKFVFNKRNSDCNRTKLSVFEGTVTSAVSNSVDFCYSKRPNKEVVMAGPYITVSLVTHGNRVQNSGFRMSYEYENTVTTIQPTTKRTTTIPSQTSSSVISTLTQTTPKSTTTPTTKSTTSKKTTQKTTTTTQKITTTTTTEGNMNIPTVTTAHFETPSSATTKKSATTPSNPASAIAHTGSDGMMFGVIGGVGGVVVIVVIITIAIVRYRRRKSKQHAKKTIPVEMRIIGSRGSFNKYNNQKHKRRSTANNPILNYEGISSTNDDVCFTLKEKGRSSKQQYPDAISSDNSPHYELGYLGPGSNAVNEENYTYVSNENHQNIESGASHGAIFKNKIISKLKEPHYAVLAPGENNQYQALMSSSQGSDSSMTKPRNSLRVDTAIGYSSPLYHTLETEDTTDSQYTALTYQQEPTYQVLEEEKNLDQITGDTGKSTVKSCKRSPSNNKSFDPSKDYLQPITSSSEDIETRQSPQNATMEPVYQVLDATAEQPIYTSADYIEPNPVLKPDKSIVGMSNRDIINHGNSSSTVDKSEDTYQALLTDLNSGSNELGSDEVYQPIISTDASYEPIINSGLTGDLHNPTYERLGATASDDIYQPLS